MHTSTSRWLLLVSLAAVLLMASGCFQAVGDTAEGTVVAERLTETPTEPPTETETPLAETTAEASQEPVEATEEATDEVLLPIASATASDTSTATLFVPTESPTVTNTATNAPADAPIGNVEGTAVAQEVTATPDDFQLTSTALIQQATDRVATVTAQYEIDQGLRDTATPTASPTTEGGEIVIPTTAAPVVTGGDCVHEVRQGENMYRLSVNYGVPINTIAAANGIVNPSLIVIGQRITIPGCGTTGFRPPATSTPSFTPTSQFGTGGGIGQGGGATAIPPVGGSTCGSQYIVQQYDTLFEISLRCGVPVASIAAANGIANINYIQFGDVLTIPPG